MELIGKEHNAHLQWLLNSWIESDSPVCFLEGFPGTGKTTIARELLNRSLENNLASVMITTPETEKDSTDDILLDLAMEFNSAGKQELAQAIDNNRPLLDVLSKLIEEPVLIIIDDFQYTMSGQRAITRGAFAKLLSQLANRKWLKGRILLITNRLVERAKWSEPYAIRTVQGMRIDDGVELLEHYAKERDRLEEIEVERRHDVVKWLGGNPRAIRLLVSMLANESLDTLIGIQPELWEMRERDVSPELIEELEYRLLQKAIDQLSDEYIISLYRLSVLRKPFGHKAIEQLFNDKSIYAQFRREMTERFLIEQRKGWYNLHPIVREIGLQKLAESPSDLQQAHSMLASYYTRHFEAKQMVGWGSLGGHFVEARYHLTKADKPDLLGNIASRFQGYIFSTLNESSPLPRTSEELDERIAVLSALLEKEPGPKSLEYHLARLFLRRKQRNDLRRGLLHIKRATKNSNFAPAWLLHSEILYEMGNNRESLEILEHAINALANSNDLAFLYDRYARLLAQEGLHDKAILVLQQGIKKVLPDKSLASMYDTLSRLLIETDAYDVAMETLREGIEAVPPTHSSVDLYNRYSELLIKTEQYSEAAKVLDKGIANIPPNNALFILYECYSDLLLKQNKPEQAIDVLTKGIRQIPSDQGSVVLHLKRSEIVFRLGKKELALNLLQTGMDNIPIKKGQGSLYSAYSRALIANGKTLDAIGFMQRTANTHFSEFVYNEMIFENLLLLSFALYDDKRIADLIQAERLQHHQFALAQTLLYQTKNLWEEAAEYAHKQREQGVTYLTLSVIEAFAWLCANKPNKALDAASTLASFLSPHTEWLNSFIQLRLGNHKAAKNALERFCVNTQIEKNLSIKTLLSLWNSPSTSLKELDLAYFFPILPTALTGLSHNLTRIIYRSSAFSDFIDALPEDEIEEPLQDSMKVVLESVKSEKDQLENTIGEVETSNNTQDDNNEKHHQKFEPEKQDTQKTDIETNMSSNQENPSTNQSNVINIFLPNQDEFQTQKRKDIKNNNESDGLPTAQDKTANFDQDLWNQLERTKMFLDKLAIRDTRRYFTIYPLISILILAVLLWLVHTYGWAAMEQWTYILGVAGIAANYFYFALTQQEWTPSAIYERYLNNRKKYYYQQSNFDMSMYLDICKKMQEKKFDV